MSGAHPPLTCKEVKAALKRLGFHPRPQKGTSHEQWVKYDRDRLVGKVTVDCPKQPFSHTLVASMAKQAGVSKASFYKAAKS
ncbi:type II toxin-antitoxin system HicA family toxin [Pseudothauera rhizosphaerae]|uniref:Type II toxin-antitoxin system HicA family toxin n=1 Tax=Pseudothauera rhizosphaerae TaxID=2565932 RepID=A0A4S4AB78_9RHOO|nr:type II toxin-antitoxin system HicA family toxin [Pseudothauera rhizosphaerae]THF55898.1 type II toxin-antitoxin system HicA family toxin [Pseudothauera rhizosphaerae]